jgi:predicted O-methyltransferase YrrM
MPSTLDRPHVHQLLDRLHREAARDDERGATLTFTTGAADDSSALRRAEERESLYMPISEPAGRLLYALTRASAPALVVEFGMSYGISTLYLAAAVADTGHGQVITTELSSTKVAATRRTLRDAGLDRVVEIREGDALRTLADLEQEIGVLLLDGWKDLYLPVLAMLEPQLVPGALVLADDTDQDAMTDYLAFVRDPANGYESVEFPVDDGVEISCRIN